MGFAHLAEGKKKEQNDMLQNLAVVANDPETLERVWGCPGRGHERRKDFRYPCV